MEIRFLIITKAKGLTDTDFFDFIKKAMSGTLSFYKYDYKEPMKKPLEADTLTEVKTLFDYYGDILFKGKNKSHMSIASYREGISVWMGSFTVNKNISGAVSEIIALVESLCGSGKVLFGKICPEDEHDHKHKVTTEYSYGWEGVSQRNFMQFLPGIYWYTIFGKELVQSIGEDKFKDLPGVVYTSPANGCVAFHLDETIETDDWETRLKREKEIARLIGENYFFDRDTHGRKFSHPEKFLNYLKSLEKNVGNDRPQT